MATYDVKTLVQNEFITVRKKQPNESSLWLMFPEIFIYSHNTELVKQFETNKSLKVQIIHLLT